MTQLGRGQYFGEAVRTTTLSHLVLTELHHPRGRALPEHAHDAPFLCLLLAGSYRERVAARSWEYRPFVVGYHPAGFVHSDEVGPGGGRFFVVEMPEAWLAGPGQELWADLGRRPPELVSGSLSVTATRLHALWRRQPQDVAGIEGLALELAGALAGVALRPECGRPAWLRHARDLLHAEFAQPLTVSGVAARVGVHPVHLSREFRRRFGLTLGHYLNLVRLRFACEELGRGRPLADLCVAAGFFDQSHFGRIFRQRIGCSPARYRRLQGWASSSVRLPGGG